MLFRSLVACDKGGDNNSDVEITNINQAYNVATELGYGGTLDEFIIAVKGDKGEDGKDGKTASAWKILL